MSHFKPFLLTFCSLLLVAGCASPGGARAQSAEVMQQQCSERVESLFPSRVGVRVRRAEMLRDCFRSAQGTNPLGEEYWAYFIYLASEADAGRISPEQANYLITQKDNELKARQNAQIIQLLPFAIQQQQQEEARRRALYPPTPTYTPSPVYNTNCTRDMFGNTNCTTQRQ